MADLTTVADVKAFAGITASTDDALLARLVAAASALIETWCGRTFASASYTDTLSGTGGDTLLLRHTPVTAVASVTVDSVALVPRPAPGQTGFVRADDAIGELRLGGGGFTRGVANVVVTYTAGYASTPPDVAQAAIDLVVRTYRMRSKSHLASEGGPNGETTTFALADLPATTRLALQPYRRVIP